jgi:single-stranded DNA-binding protein
VLVLPPRIARTRRGPVMNLSVRVEQRGPDDGGLWVPVPYIVQVAFFSDRVSGIAKLLRRGELVGADGDTKVRHHVERDGRARADIEIIAHNVWPVALYVRPDDRLDDLDHPHADE